MSALPTKPRLAVSDPDLLPTRQAEGLHAAQLLTPGHAVVVVGHPGEGRSTVTREALRLLGLAHPTPLRCSRRTTAAQLLAWFDEHLAGGVGVLDDVESLPAELADLLEDLLQDERMSVVVTADAVAMRSAESFNSHSAVEVLNDLWRRRLIGRVDLGRLPLSESLVRIRSVIPAGTLDVLQETTLARVSGGSLALARDLAEDVLANPHMAPRIMPRAWGTGYTLSSRTLHRVAARFRDQSDDVLKGSLLIYQVGPLDYSTASRLFGPELISRMESCAAIGVIPRGDDPEVTSSGVLSAGLLTEPRLAQLTGDRQRTLEALTRLVLSGVAMGDATALVLTRWLLDSGKHEDPHLGPLFVQAAAKAARHGWASEALALTAVAESAGLHDLARPIRWQALMLEDRHAEVLAEAHALLNREPAVLDALHIHRLTAAASWLPETPEWLTAYLQQDLTAKDPALAILMRLLLGDVDATPEVLAELERIGLDPQQTPATRLKSLALCITRHMSAGRVDELERCVEAGRSLRGSTRASVNPTGCLETEALVLFDTACCSAQILAGLDPTGVERVAEEMVRNAVSIGPHSGRFPAASAAYLHAVIAYHRGDTATARANIGAAMQLLDRASFATSNGYMAVLSLELAASSSAGKVDAELLGQHLALTHRTHPRMPSPIRTLAETVHADLSADTVGVRPAWAVIKRLHQDFLQERLTAAEALARIPEDFQQVKLPSSKALLKHLRAVISGDPEQLLDAAAALTGVGSFGVARHALEQARQHFLSNRQTARANDCAERLADLPPNEEQPKLAASNAIPAGLTQREFEICQLVAESLTNAQIGERLFLSVRTVESHVLQARAKLRAPRRKDIPERLQRISMGL